MNAADYARSDRMRLVRDLAQPHELRRGIALNRAQSLPPDERLDLTRNLLERYHNRLRFDSFMVLVGLSCMIGTAAIVLDNAYLWFGVLGLFMGWRLIVTGNQVGRSLDALLASSTDTRLIPILLKMYVNPAQPPPTGRH